MGRVTALAVLLLITSCAGSLKSDPGYQQLVTAQNEAAQRDAALQQKLTELANTIAELQKQLADTQTSAAGAATTAAEAAAAANQAIAAIKAIPTAPAIKPVDPVATPPTPKPIAKPKPKPVLKPGAITGKVTLAGTNTPLANVVVYVVSVPGRRARGKQPTNVPIEIRQSDLKFSPTQSVVVRGSSIAFPNEDKVFHNVFSLSDAARFDLGLYKSGSSKTVEFNEPGTVDVFCNIHPGMKAKIKVLDNAYYAYTKADGTFRIEGVPAGKRSVGAWRADLKELVTPVQVGDGGLAVLNVTTTRAATVDTHTRKDGSPYGRYK